MSDKPFEIFLLFYQKLYIGRLVKVEDDVWLWQYSQEFQEQDDIRCLVNFPNKYEVYSSAGLWDCFALRIPTPTTEIWKIVDEEGIDPTDNVAMLKRFGECCIHNPFLLLHQSKCVYGEVCYGS